MACVRDTGAHEDSDPDRTRCARPARLRRRRRLAELRLHLCRHRRERLSRTTDNVARRNDIFETWEVYAHFDIDGDGHTGYMRRADPDGELVELRGDDGHAVADGETGDLYIKGPSAALVYWGNREKSRDTFRGEWTRCGDKYIEDADGYYVCCGRADDMLVSGGENVHPVQVEEVLNEHPLVADSIVVGLADERWGEVVVAFVVAQPGVTLSTQALDAFCLNEIARFKRPKRYELVDSLPKNNYGKVLKTELRQRLAQP